jgi:hypothetical protein
VLATAQVTAKRNAGDGPAAGVRKRANEVWEGNMRRGIATEVQAEGRGWRSMVQEGNHRDGVGARGRAAD